MAISTTLRRRPSAHLKPSSATPSSPFHSCWLAIGAGAAGWLFSTIMFPDAESPDASHDAGPPTNTPEE